MFNRNTLPYIALLLAMVLWSSSFIALKVAFRYYDPMVVVFGRMLVATIFFLPLIRNFKSIKYQKGDWKYLIFMAFCEPCLYFIFEAMALKHTDVSQAGMIVAILPLLMAVAAHFFLGERVSMRTLAGFGLAIAGACILSLDAQSTENAPNPMLGNFLEFLAMICATGYIVMLKKLCARYTPLFLTAVQAFVGAVFYLPLIFMPFTTLPTEFHPVGFGAIVYLGAFITLGAYGLYNYGTSQIPASQASAFTNLIPVLTLFFGWSILGDRLTLVQYGASVLVLLGVLLSQDRKTAQS